MIPTYSAAAHETAKHKSEAVMEMPDAASSGGPNERRPELAKLSSRLIQLQLQLSDYEERLIQAHETMKERDKDNISQSKASNCPL